MKKHWIRILSIGVTFIIILGLIAFQAGWLKFGTSQKEDSKNTPANAQSNSDLPAVRASIVQNSTLVDAIKVTGTLLPNEEVDLTSEVAGKIVSINFQEGQNVAQGALLVRMSNTELLAQLERLKAQITLYESREYRQRKLLEKGGASQDEYDAVLSELNALKAQVKETQASLVKTEIRAPFSGTIGLRKVSNGSYVNPGTSIVRLVNLQKLKIEFSVPEKYSGKIKKGLKILVRSEILSGDTLEAFVYAIEPKINLETRTLTVRAELNNAQQRLIPGGFVDIEIILAQYPNTIQIPNIALIPELGGQKVFRYENGLAVSVPVKIGIRGQQSIQITEGLSVGDTLITSGILNVRPNTKVKILEVKAP
jgi:membrane fusion protein (multidrug efflux system)